MYRKTFSAGFLAIISLLASGAARADVKLPNAISDHMVLQQGIGCKIWGSADPGEKVTVKLVSAQAQATADAKGKWLVTLPAMPASAEAKTMTVAGNPGTPVLTINDILVGEVWVCSGQSNMEFGTSGALSARDEIAKADLPAIRLLNISAGKVVTEAPAEDTKATWAVCSPQTVERFSAVGFFFGRELNQKLNVPVGLINASWGGSPVEQWIPMSAYMSDPALGEFPPRIESDRAALPARRAEYPKQLEAWTATTQKMITTRPSLTTQPRQLPGKPYPPQPPETRLGGMYNGNIAPIINYGIKGVIWYQGESNATNPMGYRRSFPAMIRAWRQAWGQGDIPFLWVQLANYISTNGDWPALREAQTLTLSLPNTAMALAIDVGDARNIHPKDKQTVAHRLALGAQAIAYGKKNLAYASPMFDSMKIEGDQIRLSFKNTAGGLLAKGDKLKGFAVAGPDGKYAGADATIDGDTVLVRSGSIAQPAMVRYGWADNPDCNLYNQDGLPAVPFRAGEEQPAKAN